MLLLETREPELERCEPRVLFLQLLDLAIELTRSPLGLVDLLLDLPDLVIDVGIPSPVERRQERAPSRQR
jgi:hypothetical protein